MNEKKHDSQPIQKVCPTCGTRLSEHTEKCLVCGTTFHTATGKVRRRGASEISLSLPIALLILAVFALLAAGATYAALQLTGVNEEVTPTVTITSSPTITNTATATQTATTEPSATMQPPREYQIVEGDTCISIAVYNDVSVNSLIDLNNLGTQCLLVPGQTILIPVPTPTPSPSSTITLEPVEATLAACEKYPYTVLANDTLFSISLNFVISMDAIKSYNNMNTDIVYEGQQLELPLCEQVDPNAPTITPTPYSSYPAPNPLLPQDGQSFTLENDTITLQWASVGELRDNEFYQVIVLDVTEGSGNVRLLDTVSDTKFIIPVGFRPNDVSPHIFRWQVATVRQIGTTPDGEPQFESAGAISVERVFSWSGAAPANGE